MSRKVIALQVVARTVDDSDHPQGGYQVLDRMVLCDDGSIWQWAYDTTAYEYAWSRFPDVPQVP